VKNYNSDANNKDVITVDYMITGGRQRASICIQDIKLQSILNFENETFLTSEEKWCSNYVIKVEINHLRYIGIHSIHFVFIWGLELFTDYPLAF